MAIDSVASATPVPNYDLSASVPDEPDQHPQSAATPAQADVIEQPTSQGAKRAASDTSTPERSNGTGAPAPPAKRQRTETPSTGTPSSATPTATPTSTPAATPSATAQPKPPDQVSPARAKAIDAWADQNASPGTLSGLFHGSGNSRVSGALQGRDPSLGALTPAEQQRLLNRSVDTWAKNGDSHAISSLASDLKGKGDLSTLTSNVYANHAADIAKAAGPKSDMYTSGVSSTTREVAGSLAAGAADVAPTNAGLGATIRTLGPERAGAYADALTMWNTSKPAGSGEQSPLARGLDGINRGPNDATASAFTSHVLATDKGWNFTTHTSSEAGLTEGGPSDAAAPMGTALSRMVHPNDPAAQASDAKRFGDLVGGHYGSQLLSANLGNDQVSTTDRFRALGALAAHPELTEAGFAKRGGSPWTDPTLAQSIASGPATAMARSSGDTAVPLAGKDLDATVAAAMPGADASARDTVTNAIRKAGGTTPNVAVLPVQVSTEARGPVQVSLFRVRNGGNESYVDNEGRTYGSFQQWKNENRLPSGTMTYPENGHLTTDQGGNARLQSSNTPATPDTFGKKAVAALDDVALEGGAAAGVAVLAGGGWIPATIRGAASLYSAGRGVQHLGDMQSHGQSIDPTSSSEARSTWLGVLANGAVGAGSLAKVGSAALGAADGAGALLGRGALGLNAAGAGFSTVAGANQARDDVRNWSQLTPQQKLMAGINLGFTAAASAGAARGLYDGLRPSSPNAAGVGEIPPVAPRANEAAVAPRANEPAVTPRTVAPAEPNAATADPAAQPGTTPVAPGSTTSGSGRINRLTPAQRRQAALAAPGSGTASDLVPRPHADSTGRLVARGVDGVEKPVVNIPNEDAYRSLSSNRSNLQPNTIYKYNDKYYETNANGDSISSSGTLTDVKGGRIPSTDKKIGKSAGVASDIGFHHGGDQFGFGGGWLNLSPGDKTINGGAYKSFETYLSAMRDQGHNVVANFRAVRAGANARPTEYVVQYSLDGGPVKQRVFANTAPAPATTAP